jgi:hypothetical protein
MIAVEQVAPLGAGAGALGAGGGGALGRAVTRVAASHLALPKVIPADVSGAVDMEKVKPGPNPTPYWIAMIEGVVRILFPTAFARIEAGIGQNAGAIIAAAVVLALLGAMLIAFWP